MKSAQMYPFRSCNRSHNSTQY